MYCYGVERWLTATPGSRRRLPAATASATGTGAISTPFDVLAMPDPWEYPWFAAWDLAFHAMVWAHLDPVFAKYQVTVLLREWFQHPNGAVPAYEWSFDDLNPPVHALAALRVFNIDGRRDRVFLERVFQKLLVNFTWWLNRLDPDGRRPLRRRLPGLRQHQPDRPVAPSGGCAHGAGRRHRLDGALRARMLLMAVELAEQDPVYDDMVVKFLEHFASISRALEPQRHVGRRRGLLLRPPAAARRRGRERPRRRPSPARSRCWPATRIDARHDERTRRVGARFRRMEEAQGAGRLHAPRAGAAAPAATDRAARQPRLAGRAAHGAAHGCSTPRRSSHRTACARCPSATTAAPTQVAGRARRADRLPARRVAQRRCTAGTRTGAGRSGSRRTTS